MSNQSSANNSKNALLQIVCVVIALVLVLGFLWDFRRTLLPSYGSGLMLATLILPVLLGVVLLIRVKLRRRHDMLPLQTKDVLSLYLTFVGFLASIFYFAFAWGPWRAEPGGVAIGSISSSTRSIGGKWRSSGEGRFKLVSIGTKSSSEFWNLHVERGSDWGSRIGSGGDSIGMIRFAVLIPPDPQLVGATVSGKVQVSISYPASSGFDTFHNESEMIEEPVTIRIHAPSLCRFLPVRQLPVDWGIFLAGWYILQLFGCGTMTLQTIFRLCSQKTMPAT